MTSKTTLKTYFNTGDQPTEAQFGALIDSIPGDDDNLIETADIKSGQVTLLKLGHAPFNLPDIDLSGGDPYALIMAAFATAHGGAIQTGDIVTFFDSSDSEFYFLVYQANVDGSLFGLKTDGMATTAVNIVAGV